MLWGWGGYYDCWSIYSVLSRYDMGFCYRKVFCDTVFCARLRCDDEGGSRGAFPEIIYSFLHLFICHIFEGSFAVDFRDEKDKML